MSLSILLSKIQALHKLFQFSHWQTSGPNYYGDHLLFERIANDSQAFIDQVAEKSVGLFGQDSIEMVEDSEMVLECLNKWKQLRTESSMPDVCYVATKEVIESIVALKKELIQDSKLTDGLDNMLQGMADKLEEFVYLLQQRIYNKKEAGFFDSPVPKCTCTCDSCEYAKSFGWVGQAKAKKEHMKCTGKGGAEETDSGAEPQKCEVAEYWAKKESSNKQESLKIASIDEATIDHYYEERVNFLWDMLNSSAGVPKKVQVENNEKLLLLLREYQSELIKFTKDEGQAAQTEEMILKLQTLFAKERIVSRRIKELSQTVTPMLPQSSKPYVMVKSKTSDAVKQLDERQKTLSDVWNKFVEEFKNNNHKFVSANGDTIISIVDELVSSISVLNSAEQSQLNLNHWKTILETTKKIVNVSKELSKKATTASWMKKIAYHLELNGMISEADKINEMVKSLAERAGLTTEAKELLRKSEKQTMSSQQIDSKKSIISKRVKKAETSKQWDMKAKNLIVDRVWKILPEIPELPWESKVTYSNQLTVLNNSGTTQDAAKLVHSIISNKAVPNEFKNKLNDILMSKDVDEALTMAKEEAKNELAPDVDFSTVNKDPQFTMKTPVKKEMDWNKFISNYNASAKKLNFQGIKTKQEAQSVFREFLKFSKTATGKPIDKWNAFITMKSQQVKTIEKPVVDKTDFDVLSQVIKNMLMKDIINVQGGDLTIKDLQQNKEIQGIMLKRIEEGINFFASKPVTSIYDRYNRSKDIANYAKQLIIDDLKKLQIL